MQYVAMMSTPTWSKYCFTCCGTWQMFATTPNFRVKKQINNNVTLQCWCVKSVSCVSLRYV